MPISTVSSDQHEILRNIIALYCPNGFDIDPTYSTGGFYRDGVPEPNFKFDLQPQLPSVEQADCRSLPIVSASAESVIFDPPFIHAPGEESLMGQRFGGYKNQHALRTMYFSALAEFYRVLRPGGILVFKCQDIVESGRQILNHCFVWQMANSLGFVDLDLFILLKKSTMRGHNWNDQKHAHRGHSYFWVFSKGVRR